MTGLKRPFTEVDTSPTDSQRASQQNSSKKAVGNVSTTASITETPSQGRPSPAPSPENSSVDHASLGDQVVSRSSCDKPLSPRRSSGDTIALHPPKPQPKTIPSSIDPISGETTNARKISANPKSSKSSKITDDFNVASSAPAETTKSSDDHPAVLHQGRRKDSSPSSRKAIKTSSTGSVKITGKAGQNGSTKVTKPCQTQDAAKKKRVGKLILSRPAVTILANGRTKIGSSSSERSIKSSSTDSSKSPKKKSSRSGSGKKAKKSNGSASPRSTKETPTPDSSKKPERVDPAAMRVAVQKSALSTIVSLLRKKTNTAKSSGDASPDEAKHYRTQDISQQADNPEASTETEKDPAAAVPPSSESMNEHVIYDNFDGSTNLDDDDDSTVMKSLVKSLPPHPSAVEIDCTTTEIDFDILKRVECRARVRSILWTSKFHNELEVVSTASTGKPALVGQKKLFSHMRKLAEKAFRKMNNYRYFCGRDNLAWSEMLYEACSCCNTEMIGGGKFLDQPKFNLGVETYSIALRIFLNGDAVAARREGYIAEPVTSAILSELKKRNNHLLTFVNSHMRYGAIDIFGTEENFAVVIIVSRHPPFYFNAQRASQ